MTSGEALTDWANVELPARLRLAYYVAEHAEPHPVSGRLICTHSLVQLGDALSIKDGESRRAKNGRVTRALEHAQREGFITESATIGNLSAIGYDYGLTRWAA